jgi:hypothetical protein
MDASVLTATAQVAVQAGSAVANISPAQLLDYAVAAAGGGAALEISLEKFVMNKVPDSVKPYIPAVIAIGGGTLAAMKMGMPWQQALSIGLGTYVASEIKHDQLPASTPAVPAPPVASSTPAQGA